MGELDKLLKEISDNSNAKLWDLARLYKSYKDFATNPVAKAQFEQHLGKDLSKAFDAISRTPGGPEKMQELVKAADKWDSLSKIGPDTGKAIPVNPADLWLKQMDNVSSGVIGAAFQLLGQHLHPNDPQKATALGDIGKTLGQVASQGAKVANAKQTAKDFGKPNVLSKQLGDQQQSSAKSQSEQKNLDALMNEAKSLESQQSGKDFSKADHNKAVDHNKAIDHSKDVDHGF